MSASQGLQFTYFLEVFGVFSLSLRTGCNTSTMENGGMIQGFRDIASNLEFECTKSIEKHTTGQAGNNFTNVSEKNSGPAFNS